MSSLVEEGIFPVVFETVNADELDELDKLGEMDESEKPEEVEEEEEELDEDVSELDALFLRLATPTSTLSRSRLFLSIPLGISTFLLFSRPALGSPMTGTEAEADLFRAEVSALKRILNISPSPQQLNSHQSMASTESVMGTYVITSFSSTTSFTILPANSSNPSISNKISLVDGAVSRTVERDCRTCFLSSETVATVVGSGRRSFDSLNGARSWSRTRMTVDKCDWYGLPHRI